MKNIGIVFKKELRRFFTDKRMLLALFLPGLLIFVLYTGMSNIMSNGVKQAADVTDSSYVIRYSDNSGRETPNLITNFIAYVASQEPSNTVEATPYKASDFDTQKAALTNGEFDVLVTFSDDFELKIASKTAQNHIDLYYYGTSKKASNAYSLLSSLVRATYDTYLVNVDPSGSAIPANVAKSDYVGNMIISIIFPMVTVSLLFSTVVSVCPDAVAGEKERGTMAAMLLTPIKRRQLALGKALALLITSIASGAVSFIGLLASLPKLMSGLSFSIEVWVYPLLGALVITTLAFFVAVGLLVSTLSKSSKEASSYLGPLTVIFVALGIVAGFADTSAIGFAFVPFLNIVSCMAGLFSGTVSVPYFIITILMSLSFTGILVFASTRLFSSERIMVK